MSTGSQLHAIVRGRVQGVFFRASTQQVARRLGLAGFVRNLPDGSVEVAAAGDRARLDELVRYLHRGPELAQVASVDLDWSDRSELSEPFAIR